TITPTPGGPAPSASFSGLTDGQTVTSPVQLVGTIGSPTLASWSLTATMSGSGTPITLGSGTTPVSNAALGTLDPTLLLNGLYAVTLTAVDVSGQTTTTSVSV